MLPKSKKEILKEQKKARILGLQKPIKEVKKEVENKVKRSDKKITKKK